VSNTQNIDQKSTQDNYQMIVISSAITQGNLSPNLRRRMSRDQQVLDRMFDQPCQRALKAMSVGGASKTAFHQMLPALWSNSTATLGLGTYGK